MDSASEKQLKRLRRALSTSTNDFDREQYASAIADLGSPEAHQALVDEVSQQTRAAKACAAALRQVGPPVIPLLLHALQRDPDNRYVPFSLPTPFEDKVAEALMEACARTTDEWVVLVTAQRLAGMASEYVHRLGEVIRERRSRLFTVAMHCALVANRGGDRIASLARYLSESSSVREQDLALAFPAVRELPDGRELLRKRVTQGRVGDRAHALRLIGEDGSAEFADLVLDVWLNERSPTVHHATLWALGGIGDGLRSSIQTRAADAFAALEGSITELLASLRPGAASVDAKSRTHLDSVEALISRLGELWVAALLSKSDTPEMADEYLLAYRGSTPRLVGAALDLSGEPQAELFRLGDVLIQRQLGVLRHVWHNGRAWARLLVLDLLGLPVAALSPTAPNPPQMRMRKVAWDAFFGELSRCCHEVVYGWWRLNWGFPEGLNAANWPFAGLTAVRQRIAHLITTTQISNHEMLPALLSALQQSRQAEREAREKAERELGCTGLAGIQQEFDEQPLVLLSLAKQELADFVRSHEQPRGEIPAHIQMAAPMLAEQVFQIILLNIIAAHLSPRAAATLIECTDSDSALVVECAQALLVRVGGKTLTRLQMAVARCGNDLQRAHLLEVCRCIDAAATRLLARDYLASDDPLVVAVCCRVLEDAGTDSDVAGIKRTLAGDDELVTVSALRALGCIAPDQSVDDFACALSHWSATVRYAALWGLQQCSSEVQIARADLLSQSDDAFSRIYGRALLDPDASGALCPRFRGEPIAVADSWVLGARCAVPGPLPWQWGLGDLFAEDEDFDWAAHWPLIAHDEALAQDWIQYTLHRELPPRLLTRLATHARGPEGGAEVEQAMGLLLVLTRDALEPILRVAARYYSCHYDTVLAAAPKAFGLALRASSQTVVHSLEMPNPSLMNPLGEGYLPEFANESLAFGMVFAMLFRQALPRALSISRPQELGSSDATTRHTAVEDQWRHLMSCQDFMHGLWVEPLLTPNDLAWYCSNAEAQETLCHEMINHLVAAIGLLPHFHATREEHEDALKRIFRPLLRQTLKRLAGLHQERADREGLRQVVEEAFWAAIGEYDALTHWPTGTYLPLGTLSDFRGPQEAGRTGASPAAAGRPYMPFPLFIEKRVAALIRTERARARRIRRQGDVTADGDLEARAAADAEERWRLQEAALIEAIDKSAGRGVADDTLLGFPPVDAGWLRTRTVNIVVNGETVPCVDIESLAYLLDRSPDALRKLHRRNRVPFMMQGGIRYLPVDRIAEVRATLATDLQIAEICQVHRNTIAQWRREAPAGLTDAEMVSYLLTHKRRGRGRSTDDGMTQ